MTAILDAPAHLSPSDAYKTLKTFDLHDTAGQAKALDEDGFALIPGVMSPDEIADLRAGIDRLHAFGIDKLGLTDHYKCVFNREQLFLNYIDRPGIVELAEATMGAECHIIGETAWRSYPGHDGWNIHTDQMYINLPEEYASDLRVHLPVYICTAHYYLNDMTLDNAPTWVIPGSHRAGRSPKKGEETWNGRELIPILCKAGDVLFFRSEVWHTGSKNTTEDEVRYLLQVHYSHRMFAQKFSPWPWQYNPEILAVANPRQLRLLGKHPESNYG